MIRRLAAWAGVLAALGPVLSEAAEPIRVQEQGANLSLRLEIEHALDRGSEWLRHQQEEKTGAWGQVRAVELTGLTLTVLVGGREGAGEELDPALSRGYDYLVSRLSAAAEEKKVEQRISTEEWVRGLPALFLRVERPEFRSLLREGIAHLQVATPSSWEVEFRRREVLRTAGLLGLVEGSVPVLRWNGAGESGSNPRIDYLLGVSLSWDRTDGEEFEVWRNGVKASFSGHLRSTDVRLHEAMAKALQAGRMDRVPEESGRLVDWREKLAVRLFDLQERDGSWTGEIPSGKDADELLEMTCRALLALQTIVNSL